MGYKEFMEASGVGQQLAASSIPVVLASDQPGLSVVPGVPASTTNAVYLVGQSLAADVAGPSITVGADGRLVVFANWVASGAQIGTLVLQSLSLIAPGSAWVDIPGSSGGFGQHPNNDTAETIGFFRELQPFATVRVFYRRTSGGGAPNLFNVATKVR